MRTAIIYGALAFIASIVAVLLIYPAFQCGLAAGETLVLGRIAIGIAMFTVFGAWVGWNRRPQATADIPISD
jgi:uncharacterized membrane protein